MNATRRSSSNDTMVYALFAATLLHGLVILGITFEGAPARGTSTPLKVVLTQPEDDDSEPPVDAEFAAATNMEASGAEAAQRSGGVLLPAAAQDAVGETDGDAAREEQFAEEMQLRETLVTSSRSDNQITTPPDARRRMDPAAIRARIQHASPATAFQRRDTLQAEGPIRELDLSVAARRSDVAAYMAVWKDHVEEVGTLYFPDAARQQGLTGSPLIEVAIGADGGLRSIRVIRPSPHPLLDQAALRILRLAAPFAPFPESLRKTHDALRFTYEWRFVGGELAP